MATTWSFNSFEEYGFDILMIKMLGQKVEKMWTPHLRVFRVLLATGRKDTKFATGVKKSDCVSD